MDFNQRFQKLFDRGISVSKEFLVKAKDKAQELGEKGLLNLEIKRLEDQITRLLGKLGAEVYQPLAKGRKTISRTESMDTLVREIEEIEQLIEEKENRLRNF